MGYARQALALNPAKQSEERLKRILENLESCVSSPKNKQLSTEDFECALCLKLLYEPVTTPCGHTFCKSCLARTLDYQQCCPMCREPIHFSVEHPVNITIKNMLIKFFPQETKQREKEELSLIEQSTHSTPLFILNAQCFPGQEFNLHIFEPRYRLMMRRVMAGQKQFGLVNCLQNENGSWEMYSVGIFLKVIHINILGDGRSYVRTVGTRRFKVLEHWDLDGYKVGKVEYIEDIPKQTGQAEKEKQLAEKVRNQLTDLIEKGTSTPCGGLQRVANTMKEHMAEAPTNVDELSWWLVYRLPLSPGIKSAFLNTNSTFQRLEMIYNLVTKNPHSNQQHDQCSIS